MDKLETTARPPSWLGIKTTIGFIDKLEALCYLEFGYKSLCKQLSLGCDFRHCISQLRLTEPNELTLTGLVAWSERADIWSQRWLSQIISCLPCETIANHFGTDILIWAGAKTVSFGGCLDKITKYLTSNRLVSDDFEESCLTVGRIGDASGAFSVLRQGQIFQSLREDLVLKLELANILNESNNSQCMVSEKRAELLSLCPIVLENKSRDSRWLPFGIHPEWETRPFKSSNGLKKFWIFMDSPTGILLLYKGIPQTLVTFHARKGNTLFINQIQCLKARLFNLQNQKILDDNRRQIRVGARGIYSINAPEVMIKIANIFARCLGFEKLAVQGGQNNKWTKCMIGEDRPHITVEEAAKSYDLPAQKLNFFPDDSGDWVKVL